MLVHLAILFLLCVYESGLSVSAEKSSEVNAEEYAKRIKLLTGSSTVQKCNQNKEDLGECLRRILVKTQSRTAVGIPELNIPPTEPLRLNTTVLRFKVEGVNGRVQMKDALIRGISKAELKKVHFKVENGETKLKMHSFVPVMSVVGKYKAAVLLNNQIDLKPHGTFNLTMHGVDIRLSSEGKFFEKDGHKFIRLHNVDAEPKIANMDIDATGIFEDPALNLIALTVARQTWRELYDTLLPETRSYWAPLMMGLLNDALSLIPYDVFVTEE